MKKISPMMEQYLAVKEEHPDKLLLFQVGDFYELFFDDAVVAARELDIVLTSRDLNKENPIPLAGVPVHAAGTYLNRLLACGYKVVVCDQVEEAGLARGLVRREVTRIITPGTITDPGMLDSGRNNYLVAVDCTGEDYYGLAALDVSTGDFQITECRGEKARETIAEELCRLQPAEVICTGDQLRQVIVPLPGKQERGQGQVEIVEPVSDSGTAWRLIAAQWGDQRCRELSLERFPMAAAAAAAAMLYLQKLKHPAGGHYRSLELYFPGRCLVIDSTTSRNLELTRSLREGGKEGSLLGLIDRCLTAMGKRMLRHWLEQPLREADLIEQRLDAVEQLLLQPLLRSEIRAALQKIIDLERFCGRLAHGRVNPRELVNLKETLLLLPLIEKCLATLSSRLWLELRRQMPSLEALVGLIGNALIEESPATLREGGLFKAGYHPELDRLKEISLDGRQLLLQLEQRERERTGIKSLRVNYNRNFGFYIEITRGNLTQVPPEYMRRQTLVNAERFVTEELSRLEDQISGAREKLFQLEQQLFEELLAQAANFIPLLQEAARLLARIDCLQSLAETAGLYDYCRPRFARDNRLQITAGRHPVVEQIAGERFVPNDLLIDSRQRVLIITGPNMAGKSTYCRSIALICLMGQMGSFVPAAGATLPLLDRIFARVGAGDDLSRGQSTFMVEMKEAAAILREATPHSLIILDEIGRGTSTYDGMSIARSVLEYICRSIGAMTLFSTHYHELTGLAEEFPEVFNCSMAVKESGGKVIFLRQVIPGRADRSYGINVARLAGLPPAVTARAEAILAGLESAAASEGRQLSLLPYTAPPSMERNHDPLRAELRGLDINRMTPLEALQQLYLLQQKTIAEGRGEDGGA